MSLFSDLPGKTALITGASSGLGRHFAQVFARAGVKVGLGARRIDALQATASEIVRTGGVATAVSLDVTNDESIHAAIAAVEQQFGPIDVLVNSSGRIRCQAGARAQ